MWEKSAENFARHLGVKFFLICFVLFLTEEAYSHGGLKKKELGQIPLLLAWVTNVPRFEH